MPELSAKLWKTDFFQTQITSDKKIQASLKLRKYDKYESIF